MTGEVGKELVERVAWIGVAVGVKVGSIEEVKLEKVELAGAYESFECFIKREVLVSCKGGIPEPNLEPKGVELVTYLRDPRGMPTVIEEDVGEREVVGAD